MGVEGKESGAAQRGWFGATWEEGVVASLRKTHSLLVLGSSKVNLWPVADMVIFPPPSRMFFI